MTPHLRTVLVTSGYYPPAVRAGGAARSVAAIVDLERRHHHIVVVTRSTDLGERRLAPEAVSAQDQKQVGVLVVRADRGKLLRTLGSLMRGAESGPDALYLNSLFAPSCTIWPLFLMVIHVVPVRPILLAPRGELAPAALAIKPAKKRLAGALLRAAARKLKVAWHASNSSEADDIRNYMGSSAVKITVRADPATAPKSLSVPENAILTVAFVARMVPIKNFELLLRALRQVPFPVRVLAAGPIEDGRYWRKSRRLVSVLPQTVEVRMLGSLDEGGVEGLLRESDVMVLPTRGENFGHAIAESLSVGCPVMVPDTTLWTPLVQAGCGWVIDVSDAGPLARGLTDLEIESNDQRRERRDSALALYSDWWSRTQTTSASLFDDVLGIP